MALLLVVTGVLAGAPSTPLAVAPAGAEARTTGCTEAGVTWRVDFTLDPSWGGVVRVDDLTRIEGGASTDATGLTWELRWDLAAGEWGDPPDGPPTDGPHHAVRGPLADIDDWRSAFQSPRLITPDGSCQVYLTPFPNLGSQLSWPAVGVLGDGLLQQLNDPERNVDDLQGHVEEELNAVGIRAEVEGQAGARWSDDGATDPLDRAGSYLLDEYRGLLEHDVDGFVVALGTEDARYIAAGATQAEREARRDAVYDQLLAVGGEMADRTACLQVVTAPENASSLSPHYAWAADQVNNLFRWVTATAPPESGVELVDFGADAAAHTTTSGDPWFGPDNVHLNAAGRDAFADTLTGAARRCAEGVVLWGAPGTLDQGRLAQAGATALPSGQPFATRAVDGWGFEPGKGPHFSTVAADGTLFFMSAPTSGNVFIHGGEGMALTAFHPDQGTFANIPIETDRDVAVPERVCEESSDLPWDGPWCGTSGIDRLAYDIGDVDTVHDGESVVLTGYGLYGGQDIETQGQFPAFAVVTQRADGTWQVAEGPDGNGDGRPDWRNAWSPRDLYDIAPAAVRPRLDQICPLGGHPGRIDPEGRAVRDCGWTNEIAVLPDSGHVVVTHYGGPGLTVLEVGEPDAQGRVGLTVVDAYVMPPVDDPANPGEELVYTPREVQADPTGTLGDERFGIEFDYTPGFVEFSYDPAAGPGERIVPVSAPVLSGELTEPPPDSDLPRQFMSHQQFRYDSDGNLWVPSGATRWGGDRLGIKVYANSPSGRKLTSPECLETGPGGQPLPLEDYVATSPEPGVEPAWGKVCAPDYNLVQARALGVPWGVAEDPTTGNMVVSTWPAGESIVIDAEGSGDDMTFRVGNVANPMAQSVTLDPVEGPCPTEADPDRRCTAPPGLQAIQGPVDASGRLWLGVRQSAGGNTIQLDHPEMMMHRFDQWAVSVDVSRLMGRVSHPAPAQPGQSLVVQAEQSQTFDTTTQQPGQVADTDVVSVSGLTICREHRLNLGQTCTDPVSGVVGDGYALGNPVGGGAGFGVLPETEATYQVVVPKDGTYQVAYRATDRNLAGDQRVRLTVDGQSYDTSIHCPAADPGCDARRLQTIAGPALTLAAGTYTLQLTVPSGAHGWELDWLRFTRQ